MEMEHVEGDDRGSVVLYALSTCIHCRRTRELLASLHVAYDYVYVDLLPEAELHEALKKVMDYNPRGSFPTLIIGDTVIVGFREKEIRKVLGFGPD
jgi:glutaredoxin-like protein NrdH